MKTRVKLAAAAAIILPLAACGPDVGGNQIIATIIGAGAGGAVGAHLGDGDPLAVGIGTLIGAMVGGEIGRSMDVVDRQMALQTTLTALNSNPTGTVSTWQNPDNGHMGTVTPTKTIKDPITNNFCREFTHTVTIGGQIEEAFGTACYQPDGSWAIQ